MLNTFYKSFHLQKELNLWYVENATAVTHAIFLSVC